MFHISRLRLLLLFLTLAVATCGLEAGTSLAAGQDPSPDQSLLRAAVTRYFDSYAKKDLDDLLKLWSAKAPDAGARKARLEQLFAANDKIEVKNLTVRLLTVDGNQASARIEVEISAVDTKTSKPAQGFGRMNRVMRLVRENGAWMIWREVAAEQELAEKRAAANSDEGRSALLATEKDLVTAELARDLVREGTRLARDESFEQALAVCELARKVFERNGDKS